MSQLTDPKAHPLWPEFLKWWEAQPYSTAFGDPPGDGSLWGCFLAGATASREFEVAAQQALENKRRSSRPGRAYIALTWTRGEL